MAKPIHEPTSAQEADRPSRGGIKDQIEGAEKSLSETGADLSEKANELASDAKQAVIQKAEGAKQGLSGGLTALGGALRAAGEHLSDSGQAGTSKLAGEAASGLENFARSLESKSLGEVLEEMRALGRNNAGALFAGSMLAGLALGRLLRSANAESTAGDRLSSGMASASSEAPHGEPPTHTSPAPPVTATSGYES